MTPDSDSSLEALREPLRPSEASTAALSRRERILAGQDAARARGVRIGRPPALDVDDQALAVELYAAGRSLRAVAGELGIGVSTVRRVLERCGVTATLPGR